MARKCSFGKTSREMTTRTNPYLLPLAHLLRGPQYADWSTINLWSDSQALVNFDGIGNLVSTMLLKHLQDTADITKKRTHDANTYYCRERASISTLASFRRMSVAVSSRIEHSLVFFTAKSSSV